jgi:hypothetical protein
MLKPRIRTVQVSGGTMRDVPCSHASLALAASRRPRHNVADGDNAWFAGGAQVAVTMLERSLFLSSGLLGPVRARGSGPGRSGRMVVVRSGSD